MKDTLKNRKGKGMKIYKVITAEHRTDMKEEFFTSKNKALGYIIGCMSSEKHPEAIVRQADGRWWNAPWCKDTEIIFDSKYWNKYEYVMNNGIVTMRIDAITVY